MAEKSENHETRVRILEAVRAAHDGITADELARQLEVHPNTVRFHLARLVSDGDVTSDEAPASGRGRPRRLFRERPHMEPGGRRDYLTLARVALAALADVPNARGRAVDAGYLWGRQRAAEIPQRAHDPDPIARELTAMGFGAQSSQDHDTTVIRLHQCPFLEAVDEYGDLVCAAHLGLIRALADTWEPGSRVESLTPFAEPGTCVARLAPCTPPSSPTTPAAA